MHGLINIKNPNFFFGLALFQSENNFAHSYE